MARPALTTSSLLQRHPHTTPHKCATFPEPRMALQVENSGIVTKIAASMWMRARCRSVSRPKRERIFLIVNHGSFGTPPVPLVGRTLHEKSVWR